MRIRHLFTSLFALALMPAGVLAGAATSHAAGGADPTPPTQPTLVDVRVSHHTTDTSVFDRIVFEYDGGLPSDVGAKYVDQLVADGSGRHMRIAGRAILRVRMSPALAHTDAGVATVPVRTAYLTPNVLTTVRSGDFEGVVTYGIGLAKHTRVHVFTASDPDRVVVDVRAGFTTVPRQVWFFDQKRFADNTPPFFVPVMRPVIPTIPATALMDRVFAGPTPDEIAANLLLVRSRATGFTMMSISHHIARVQLKGDCSSGGSTVTIAGEIMPTLRQLARVDWVKIYDAQGLTETPDGPSDSIPVCLEP
jgi:hypothetical protein